MSNEAKGPYTVEQDAESRQFVVKTPLGKCLYWSEYPGDCHRMAEQINAVHTSALTSQAARVKGLEEANKAYAAELLFIRDRFGATEEEGCLMWMNCDNEALREYGELSDASDAFLKTLTPKEPQQ